MKLTGIEAAGIGRRPDGKVFCVAVVLQYSKPLALASEIEVAQAGRTVFVRREDAPAVLAALTGEFPQ